MNRFLKPQVLLPMAVVGAIGGTGAYGASLGLILWSTFRFALVAALALAGIGILAWFLWSRSRASRMSGEMLKRSGRGEASADPSARDIKKRIEETSAEFKKNIQVLLRKKKNGIPLVYYLPWYLIMGAPGVGKTALIRGSDLGWCVNEGPVTEGGTLRCDWFFTNRAVFLDTAGRLTDQEGGKPDREEYRQLLKLIKKYRKKRPIDGLIVAVEASTLLDDPEKAIGQAKEVRDRFNEAVGILGIRFPIFVVVTKCDLIDGFVDYVGAMRDASFTHIHGWTNRSVEWKGIQPVEEAFERIRDRYEEIRPALMEETESRSQRRRMYPFVKEFEYLQTPFLDFMSALFREDMLSGQPLFAGFYFTSGTQVGQAVSVYFEKLRKRLGLEASRKGQVHEAAEKDGKAYFVKDLFFNTIIRTRGRIVHVDSERNVRRRLVAGISLVAVAALALLLTTGSFLLNSKYLEEFPGRFQQAMDGVEDADDYGLNFSERLDVLGSASAVVDELYDHPFFADFGLNQRIELRANAGEIYRVGFDRTFWDTIVRNLNDPRPGMGCEDRCDWLLAYLQMTSTEPGQLPDPERLENIPLIRDSPLLEKEERDAMVNALRASWRAYWRQLGDEDRVAGRRVHLSRAAGDVAEVCGETPNPLEGLQEWSVHCRSDCFPVLEAISRLEEDTLLKRRKNVSDLSKELRTIENAGTQEIDRETIRKLADAVRRLSPESGGRRDNWLQGDSTGSREDTCEDLYFEQIAPVLRNIVREAKDGRNRLDSLGDNESVRAVQVQNIGVELDALVAQLVQTVNSATSSTCPAIAIPSERIIAVARSHALGGMDTLPDPDVPAAELCPLGGYTAKDWKSCSDRLTEAAGWIDPHSGASRAEEIEARSRQYARRFTRHWKQKIVGMRASGEGVQQLYNAPGEFTARLDSIRNELAGLKEVETEFKDLAGGPQRVLLFLDRFEQDLSRFEGKALETGEWLENTPRSRIILKTRNKEGPVPDLCSFTKTTRDFQSVFLRPLTEAWNGVVLKDLSKDRETIWKNRLNGFLELVNRYPFDRTDSVGVSEELLNRWLCPQNGELIALARDYLGRDGDLPCNLSAGEAAGPEAVAMLEAAADLSRYLYGEREDCVPMQNLTLTPMKVEAPDSVKVSQVKIKLSDEIHDWNVDQRTPDTLAVSLPASQSTRSSISVMVRKTFKKFFGRKKIEERTVILASKSGPWSALRLLEEADKEVQESGEIILTWRLHLEDTGETVIIRYRGDANVRDLLREEFSLNEVESFHD